MPRSITLTSAAFVLALTTAVGLLAAPARAADDTYDLRITVVSPTGDPVPGVVVSSGDTPLFGHTDADGRLQFHAVSVTQFPQPSMCTGLDAATQHLAGPTGWAPFCKSAPAPVNGVSRLLLRFNVGSAVAGTLTDARTGKPVRDAPVIHVEGPEGTFVSEVTDRNGRYLVPNLPAGDYGGPFTGGADSPAAPHGYVSVTLGGDSVRHRVGQVTELGVQRLTPLVQYHGTVRTTAGDIAPNATVQVGTLDGDPSTPFVSYLDATTVASQGGTWSLTVPWSHTPHRQLCAYSDLLGNGHPAGLGLRCFVSDSAGFTIQRDVALGDGGAVRGSVTGPAASDLYSAYVVVRVNGEDVQVGRVAVSRATYTVAGVPAGTRTVTVETRDQRTFTSTPVTVRANTTTKVPAIATT